MKKCFLMFVLMLQASYSFLLSQNAPVSNIKDGPTYKTIYGNLPNPVISFGYAFIMPSYTAKNEAYIGNSNSIWADVMVPLTKCFGGNCNSFGLAIAGNYDFGNNGNPINAFPEPYRVIGQTNTEVTYPEKGSRSSAFGLGGGPYVRFGVTDKFAITPMVLVKYGNFTQKGASAVQSLNNSAGESASYELARYSEVNIKPIRLELQARMDYALTKKLDALVIIAYSFGSNISTKVTTLIPEGQPTNGEYEKMQLDNGTYATSIRKTPLNGLILNFGLGFNIFSKKLNEDEDEFSNRGDEEEWMRSKPKTGRIAITEEGVKKHATNRIAITEEGVPAVDEKNARLAITEEGVKQHATNRIAITEEGVPAVDEKNVRLAITEEGVKKHATNRGPGDAHFGSSTEEGVKQHATNRIAIEEEGIPAVDEKNARIAITEEGVKQHATNRIAITEEGIPAVDEKNATKMTGEMTMVVGKRVKIADKLPKPIMEIGKIKTYQNITVVKNLDETSQDIGISLKKIAEFIDFGNPDYETAFFDIPDPNDIGGIYREPPSSTSKNSVSNIRRNSYRLSPSDTNMTTLTIETKVKGKGKYYDIVMTDVLVSIVDNGDYGNVYLDSVVRAKVCKMGADGKAINTDCTNLKVENKDGKDKQATYIGKVTLLK